MLLWNDTHAYNTWATKMSLLLKLLILLLNLELIRLVIHLIDHYTICIKRIRSSSSSNKVSSNCLIGSISCNRSSIIVWFPTSRWESIYLIRSNKPSLKFYLLILRTTFCKIFEFNYPHLSDIGDVGNQTITSLRRPQQLISTDFEYHALKL